MQELLEAIHTLMSPRMTDMGLIFIQQQRMQITGGVFSRREFLFREIIPIWYVAEADPENISSEWGRSPVKSNSCHTVHFRSCR